MNEASAKGSTQQCLFTELQRLKEEAEEKGESTRREQSVFFSRSQCLIDGHCHWCLT